VSTTNDGAVAWNYRAGREEVLVSPVADAARLGQIEVMTYLVEIPVVDHAWAGLHTEELEAIRDVLMAISSSHVALGGHSPLS
jgi:hypothetical protein